MNPGKLAKPFLNDINPYKPGKPMEQVQRERGITTPLVKLASNENPYPPHETIRQALIKAIDGINRYPESGAPDLTTRIANLLDVEPEEVFVGNGTNEIIDLLVRAYVEPDENTVFSALSFVIYKLVSKQCGVGGIEVPSKDYRHDLPAMAQAVNKKTKIVFLCNPNNPTGTVNSADEVESFLSNVPDNVLVVFDQAYLEYVDTADYPDVYSLRKKRNTIISLRTFSKTFSLAGLRIGYAIADKEVVEILNKMRQPFNVNRLAQAAALAALECRDELSGYIDETIRERERIRNEIISLGCECPSSQTNFLFVIPKPGAENVCRHLEDLGIIVRPCEQ
ncbi:MAG: histidinol-phosphate transaminase, partial [Candidatus Latescibacterota bacterium]